jgi:hypothetical protein
MQSGIDITSPLVTTHGFSVIAQNNQVTTYGLQSFIASV